MKPELFDDYRGRWVAVSDAGDVIADAAELGALLHLVDSLGIVANVIHRVPELSEPLAVGLG